MKPEDPREGKQTNLAEGEREVINQSIQAHEQKGDLKTSGGQKASNTREQNPNKKRG
ncbi:MAG TPA: hypothetical protein VN519_08620 [Bryobacteraceae bacterium]|nr:hypothetical protein [Bryobacteraceae bacterium]